jgi:hypothetical protein
MSSAMAAYWGGQKRPMRARNDTELAATVRQHVLTAAGRTSLTGDRLDKLILAQVKTRFPRAVDTFGKDAIVALLHRPEGGCSWCPRKPVPTATAALRKLLGSMCRGCRIRSDAQPVAQDETRHIAAVVAAGLKPEAAANLRTSEQIADYRRRLEALNRAKLPPRAATGVIRPVTRKTPAPNYYRPGRPR